MQIAYRPVLAYIKLLNNHRDRRHTHTCINYKEVDAHCKTNYQHVSSNLDTLLEQ